LERVPVDATLAAGHEEQHQAEQGAPRDPHGPSSVQKKEKVDGRWPSPNTAVHLRSTGGEGGGSGLGPSVPACATVRAWRTLPSGRRPLTAGSIRPPGLRSSAPSSWSGPPATTPTARSRPSPPRRSTS